MDCESSDETIFEALVVVHLDEFVQVNAEEVEDATQMISEDEVFSELHDSFDAVWITFFEKKEKLSFNGSLIVVLLLVFYQLNGD